MAERATVDVAIVGGGPAGQAAALQLAAAGIAATVIDEQPRAGGQILRQPPSAVAVRDWLAGRSYRALKAQLAAFEDCNAVTWRGGTSVIGLSMNEDGAGLTLADGSGVERLHARHVLVAAGCHDLAVPMPGWTLPGVQPAGAVQAMLKSQQMLPEGATLFAGTHPLQLIVAAQLVRAGATVAGVHFAQPLRRFATWLSPAAAIARSADLADALAALATLRRARVPVRFGSAISAIEGAMRVERAIVDGVPIACDQVALCYGFVPQSALPRMAGATMRAAGPAGGFATVADDWMASSVPGLWVAGETTGVQGAPAAACEGAIAGIGIAQTMRAFDLREAERRAAPFRAAYVQHRTFAAVLDRIADPRDHFPPIAPDTIVCRCEAVPRAALAGGSANAVKLASRCGMGLCQGRNCEPTLLRLLGAPDGPGFTARFPARPVALGMLAGD
ncbi:FAD/NAD(P)-dependent oxidoreductase [Sphingomonas baiyangensis]|uniref:FAD-dependent oxidoreductase n=1 Tax=Sphingomonas baiyangensis TaxID=2572576 RepID=A0A4U1L3Q0_9SPHN|nr:NAD(P)/FAD-dependent oxidoreductase [Sphingomonas baiyangensis]TKD50755.1 FAD-dependent oxidoreductase [Sphingomonas baiyangensis]